MNIEKFKNDNLSKYLIQKLSEEKPDWLSEINFKKNQYEDSYFINLKFLSKGFQTFLLTTEGDELSVFMDFFHTHFYGDYDEMYQEAVHFIQDITEEKLITVSAFVKDEKWFYSTCIEPIEIEKEINDIFLKKSHSKIIIQSFLNTFNRVIYGTRKK
ncbi:hypothetical protein LEP1GSC018_0966 [Leptospira kirschneri str. 2008720114]|uniref:hypothetical protein n=1 Tax=Leptospira kirschneri TaxID=29507 RepID=UPI00029816FB|nr:hypothetical protein [Leptospira kirschneri]EKP05725.1 hypothetical protein LEP1GSC018_0966 [Leptospira kirschneri str. 2008720114]